MRPGNEERVAGKQARRSKLDGTAIESFIERRGNLLDKIESH
jgi:hypothetical protein